MLFSAKIIRCNVYTNEASLRPIGLRRNNGGFDAVNNKTCILLNLKTQSEYRSRASEVKQKSRRGRAASSSMAGLILHTLSRLCTRAGVGARVWRGLERGTPPGVSNNGSRTTL
ncbi:hypothetical protein EVAR_77512_1 [Eumeta japonica]|uniref:Uncharacterized protein n=1 Tax=Eumeta variegata TaxID=151549 RepID=A0A4C1T939_EUMVA|nr:hypothetical protein EVAR_77512_1 [Eumeta japonica]